MPVRRGDVVLVFIAAITSNTSRVREPHQMLIDVSTKDGVPSGLLHNSAVRCERLHTLPQSDIRRCIGHSPDIVMREVDACLKASLGIS